MIHREGTALTLREKAGYGAAEAGMTACEVFIQLYLLEFYARFAGLDPRLAGTALAIAVFWDAAIDPVVGLFSDRLPFKSGGRRVAIAVGGLLLGLSFPFLFHPPDGATSQAALFVHLLVSYLCVNASMTILSVPHAAYGGELSRDPNERTQLYGFRLLWGNVGLIVGTILPSVLAPAPDQPAAGRATASVIAAVLVTATAALTFLSTRRRDPVRPGRDGRRALPGMRTILGPIRNRAFLILFAAFFTATIGRTINSSFALYYYGSFLELSERDTVVQVLGVFILSVSVAVPAWVLISRKFGKKMPAFAGILALGALSAVLYPLFPARAMAGPLIMAVVGGFLVASVILLDSLVTDVVDLDFVRSRENREGLYFGLWRMSAKISRAMGLLLAGFLLSAAGVEQNQALSESQKLLIGTVFGPVVGLFFILGSLVFLFMPLGRRATERIHTLAQRLRSREKTAGAPV